VARVRPKLDRNDRSKYRGELVRFHGVELKLTKQDLKQDQKFVNYLDYVHMMYFAVPSELVPDALLKLEPFPKIGIVDFKTCEVIKRATFTEISEIKKSKIALQMLF
jgi:hypothetical protein